MKKKSTCIHFGASEQAFLNLTEANAAKISAVLQATKPNCKKLGQLMQP